MLQMNGDNTYTSRSAAEVREDIGVKSNTTASDVGNLAAMRLPQGEGTTCSLTIASDGSFGTTGCGQRVEGRAHAAGGAAGAKAGAAARAGVGGGGGGGGGGQAGVSGVASGAIAHGESLHIGAKLVGSKEVLVVQARDGSHEGDTPGSTVIRGGSVAGAGAGADVDGKDGGNVMIQGGKGGGKGGKDGKVLVFGDLEITGDVRIVGDGSFKIYEDGVNAITYADYVFNDDYPLMPLDTLGAFVRSERHLPNVTTAEEVARGGIDLLRHHVTLLEKVEETTLYTLQLHAAGKALRSALGDERARRRAVEAAAASAARVLAERVADLEREAGRERALRVALEARLDALAQLVATSMSK
jgi:hypothetical protein